LIALQDVEVREATPLCEIISVLPDYSC